jgi:hypothetical protein
MCVHKFDRIFNCQDVASPITVDLINHGGQSGALSRTSRPNNQDQTVWGIQQLRTRCRSAKFVKWADAVRDNTQGQGHASSLSKGVGAKSADTVDSEGKVNLMIVVELLSLCLVHEAADHAIKFDGTKIGHPFNWNQVATQADHRGATKGEM